MGKNLGSRPQCLGVLRAGALRRWRLRHGRQLLQRREPERVNPPACRRATARAKSASEGRILLLPVFRRKRKTVAEERCAGHAVAAPTPCRGVSECVGATALPCNVLGEQVGCGLRGGPQVHATTVAGPQRCMFGCEKTQTSGQEHT